MKYLIDINGRNDYRCIELNDGEKKEVKYLIGNDVASCIVTPGKVIEMPTTKITGSGFVKLYYPKSGRAFSEVCIIAKEDKEKYTRVKDVIREQKSTLTEVAKTLGISNSTLSNTITKNPTIDTLAKIADALGVPLKELIK